MKYIFTYRATTRDTEGEVGKSGVWQHWLDRHNSSVPHGARRSRNVSGTLNFVWMREKVLKCQFVLVLIPETFLRAQKHFEYVFKMLTFRLESS